MAEFIDRFLNYIQYEKRFSTHTLLAYKQDLSQFLAFVSENFQVTDLTSVNHSMIRSWTISLIEKKESASTVNRKISCIKSFYKFQLKTGVIQQNPTSKIIRPKMPKRLPKDVSENKLQDVKDRLEINLESDTLDARRDYTMFMTFYFCGMRRSELIDLKWSQFNGAKKELSIVGKGKKQRIIPINDVLWNQLQVYKEDLVKNNVMAEDDLVFVLNNGKKLYPNFVYRIIKQYLGEVTTQKGVGPHSLRHSFATHLLNKGAELNAIKSLLGHSSLASTQVYTHNSIEKLKNIHKLSHPKS